MAGAPSEGRALAEWLPRSRYPSVGIWRPFPTSSAAGPGREPRLLGGLWRRPPGAPLARRARPPAGRRGVDEHWRLLGAVPAAIAPWGWAAPLTMCGLLAAKKGPGARDRRLDAAPQTRRLVR